MAIISIIIRLKRDKESLMETILATQIIIIKMQITKAIITI